MWIKKLSSSYVCTGRKNIRISMLKVSCRSGCVELLSSLTWLDLALFNKYLCLLECMYVAFSKADSLKLNITRNMLILNYKSDNIN